MHVEARTEAAPAAGSAGLPPDFSLVLGGPLYQLLLKAHLTRPPLELVHRRIIAALAVTWAPLAVLSALSGTLLGGVEVPFLLDLDTQVKLLFSLPLLIGAELIVHSRMRPLVLQFIERGLIAPEERPRFDAIVAGALRLRNSIPIELALLLLVFTAGYWVWRSQSTLPVSTWVAAPTGELTAAGWYCAFVAMPLARFVLVRWYFRLFIWYYFLARVARLPLRLNPLHPDRAGGLQFLGASIDALAPILIAQTALVAGVVGNQILHTSATLPDYRLELIAFAAFLAIIVLLPLCFFAFRLAEAKRTGLREYGRLAQQYAEEFRAKWMPRGGLPSESPLGSGDIQSLADLGNSFEVVRDMKVLPFGRNAIVRLAGLIVLPLLPLMLTMVPLEELVDRLLKLLL